MLCLVGLICLGILAVGQSACPDDSKYLKIPDHSACADASVDATNIGVSDDDETLIVNEHNQIRKDVSPAATDMLKMSWDNDLAYIAQAWASTCNLYHDSNYKRVDIGRFSVGQNLAMNSTTWTAAVALWASEKVNLTYGVPTTKTIGHYTQIVWAKTYKVGCGYAECNGTKYYVCNYGPAGNFEDDKYTPWTSGTSCGNCTNNCVDDKLCNCVASECLNGGTFDVATCNCTCTQSFYGGALPFYQGDSCALNCTGVAQPAYCGGAVFTKDLCSLIPTAYTHCPDMCGLC